MYNILIQILFWALLIIGVLVAVIMYGFADVSSKHIESEATKKRKECEERN